MHTDQSPERQAQIHDAEAAGNGTVNARLERLAIRRQLPDARHDRNRNHHHADANDHLACDVRKRHDRKGGKRGGEGRSFAMAAPIWRISSAYS